MSDIIPFEEAPKWEIPDPVGPPSSEPPAAAGVNTSTIEQIPASPSEPVVEGAPAPSPERTEQRKRSLLERVHQLTGRYRATERENDTLKTELSQLANIVREQNEAISRLSTAPRQTPSGLHDPPADGSTPSPVMDLRAIDELLARRLDPLTQKVAQTDASFALRNAHEASFSATVREYPELGKPESEARMLFDELYQTHPYRTLPDAPAHIAIMVRGLLADQRTQERRTAARKTAAVVHTPTPTITDELPNTQAQAAAQTARGALAAYKGGDNSPETYIAARRALTAARRPVTTPFEY